jgi:hypothetical protein
MSLASPPLGCGNGGLEWSEVGPLIWRKLHNLPFDIAVYAPYGTPRQQLTNEFLSARPWKAKGANTNGSSPNGSY